MTFRREFVKVECHCPRARHQHGTRQGYDMCGCRCIACCSASARARSGDLDGTGQGLIPRTATRRRLEALHANGWSGAELGRLLGITFEAVFTIRTARHDIYPASAQRIADLYDQIWDKPPSGRHAVRTSRWAASKGFAPPLAWDDDTIDNPDAEPYRPPVRVDWTHPDRPPAPLRRHEAPPVDNIAVELAMRGDKVRLTQAERVEAVRLLTRRGVNDTEIARRLRMSGASVTHYQAKDQAA